MTDSPQTAPKRDPKDVTSDEAINALMFAQGNAHLAAERLNIEPHHLPGIISADPVAPSILNSQLRTLTILLTFETFRLTHQSVLATLQTFEPKELVSILTKLGDQLERLSAPTRASVPNVNITEYILRSLPADQREALLALMDPENATPAPDGKPFAAHPSLDEPLIIDQPIEDVA